MVGKLRPVQSPFKDATVWLGRSSIFMLSILKVVSGSASHYGVRSQPYSGARPGQCQPNRETAANITRAHTLHGRRAARYSPCLYAGGCTSACRCLWPRAFWARSTHELAQLRDVCRCQMPRPESSIGIVSLVPDPGRLAMSGPSWASQCATSRKSAKTRSNGHAIMPACRGKVTQEC